MKRKHNLHWELVLKHKQACSMPADNESEMVIYNQSNMMQTVDTQRGAKRGREQVYNANVNNILLAVDSFVVCAYKALICIAVDDKARM